MAISASMVMELRSATGAGMMDCKKALLETDGDLDAAKDYLRKKGISIAQKKADRETNEGAVAISVSSDGKQAGIMQLACETDFVARNDEFKALIDQLANQVLQKGGENLSDQDLASGNGKVSELITVSIGKMGENLQIVDGRQLKLDGEGIIAGYVHSNQKIGVLVGLTSDKSLEADKLEGLGRDIAMHIAASQVSALSEDDLDPAELAKEKEIFLAQAVESGKPPEIAEKMVQGRMKKFVKEVSLLDQPFVKNPDQSIRQLVEEAGKNLGASLKVESFIKLQF